MSDAAEDCLCGLAPVIVVSDGMRKENMTGAIAANLHEGSRSEILADYLFASWGAAMHVRRAERALVAEYAEPNVELYTARLKVWSRCGKNHSPNDCRSVERPTRTAFRIPVCVACVLI